MNNSFDRLIDGMCTTLRAEVLTRLDDEFARGQVFGVINLLNTFKARADWSPGFLLQQLQAQTDALAQVGASLAAVTAAPVVTVPAVPPLVTANELLAQRDANNSQIGALLGWLADHRDTVPQATASAVESHLRLAMRKEIEIELKNAPRPLFAEMSSGQENPSA